MKNKMFILLPLLILICGVAIAQDYYTDSQKKLLARRAAVVDGYRQLAETIKGVRISSNTTVRDFVAINDEINASMERFVVRGAQIIATRYHADGACEVDMEIHVNDLINFLELARGHYRHAKWENVNFDDILPLYRKHIIKAVGTGAPPGGLTREEQGLVSENQDLKQQIVGLKLTVEQFDNKLKKAHTSQKLLYKENKALKSELDAKGAVERRLTQVIRENQELKKNIEQAQEQRLSLKAEIGQMADSLTKSSAYKQKYQMTQEQANHLQEKLDQLRKEKQKLYAVVTEQRQYQKKYQQALEKISDLQQKYQAENRQRQNIEKATAKLEKNVKTLQAQLKNANKWKQKFEIEHSKRQTIKQEQLRIAELQEKAQNNILQKKRKIAQLEIELANARNTGAWVAASPQQKLMARRAAILDGYRQLYETLQGVKIDSKTTVRDFVTTSDKISSSVQGYVRGAQATATRYMPNGTCEVDMEVSAVDFVRFLKKAAGKNGKRHWKKKLDKLQKNKRRAIFRVTGSGTFKE